MPFVRYNTSENTKNTIYTILAAVFLSERTIPTISAVHNKVNNAATNT